MYYISIDFVTITVQRNSHFEIGLPFVEIIKSSMLHFK